MNFIFKLPKSNFLVIALLAVFFLFFLVDSSLVLHSAHLLRPSADDYCFGRLAQSGVLGGTLRWWNTWTGNLASAFIQNLLVGLPLAFLPWKFVSSISFISATVALVFLVFMMGYKKISSPLLVGLSLSTPFIWWTYLLAPRVFGKIQPYPFANGLIHWQTINAGSVICTAIILISIFLMLRLQSNRIKFNLFLTSSLGLFAGLCGEPLNIIAIFTALSISLYVYLIAKGRFIIRSYAFFSYSFFVLIGLLISHQSPGYLIRLSRINPNLSLSADRLVELVLWTIPTSISNLIELYINMGSLFVLLIVIGISYLYYKIWKNTPNINLKIELFICLWFAITFLLLSRLLEAFSYFGYWHQIPSLICVFLSLVLIGIYIGHYLSKKVIGSYSILLVTILFLAILIGGLSSFSLVKSVKDRHVIWQQKPAELEGISDTADPNGWQMECWREVAKFRGDAPSRGQ